MRGVFFLAPFVGLARIPFSGDGQDAKTRYAQSTPENTITRLQKRIDSGQVTLEYESERGYLPALLKALQIPLSSQMLVFSKTSVQREAISPETPRALYFNDTVYIGYVPKGPALEVATADPQLGAVYYVLLQRPKTKPQFFRNIDVCMECHGNKTPDQIPVHVMNSVSTDAEGTPDPSPNARSYQTTDASPFRERWGGWYVTGQRSRLKHWGNGIARKQGQTVLLAQEKGKTVPDLRRLVNTSSYLSPYSDIVALMVIGHQTHLQNLITKANYETNRALNAEKAGNKSLGRPQNDHADSTRNRVKAVCEPLLKAMLFVGEAPLTEPIAGTSGFAERFASRGPRDRKQRSLREFDLKRRLFRYPCSYTIYSEAFDALPDLAKETLFDRLWAVLSGRDQDRAFAHLSQADRKAIREILLDTKPAFAARKPGG